MMGLRKPAAKQILGMLAAQHEALLGGDLDVLGRMAPELEHVFARLRRERGSKEELVQIKTAAARNARLLMAAQAGVASARARLSASRSTQLTTYGANGKSQTDTSAASRTIARR